MQPKLFDREGLELVREKTRTHATRGCMVLTNDDKWVRGEAMLQTTDVGDVGEDIQTTLQYTHLVVYSLNSDEVFSTLCCCTLPQVSCKERSRPKNVN